MPNVLGFDLVEAKLNESYSVCTHTIVGKSKKSHFKQRLDYKLEPAVENWHKSENN